MIWSLLGVLTFVAAGFLVALFAVRRLRAFVRSFWPH
jgi:hypothetical protein